MANNAPLPQSETDWKCPPIVVGGVYALDPTHQGAETVTCVAIRVKSNKNMGVFWRAGYRDEEIAEGSERLAKFTLISAPVNVECSYAEHTDDKGNVTYSSTVIFSDESLWEGIEEKLKFEVKRTLKPMVEAAVAAKTVELTEKVNTIAAQALATATKAPAPKAAPRRSNTRAPKKVV